MLNLKLTDAEFELFRELLYSKSGISLSDTKQSLVVGRLSKRLVRHGFTTFSEYFNFISTKSKQELQAAIDLLTTNETYFFREDKHFEFLLKEILPGLNNSRFRLWSAASSSGEEAYTLAMILAMHYRGFWEVVGSDISETVLQKARSATYDSEKLYQIPEQYRKLYCVKGKGESSGQFTFAPEVKSKVSFHTLNLLESPVMWESFDTIFLRNVLIYFDRHIKMRVIENVISKLKPNGYLIVGHAESLSTVTEKLTMIRPSIYRLK